MNDSKSALVFDGETNQNSHSRQVTLHKVIGSVKRVNPNDSISGIESFEFFNWNFVLAVVFMEHAGYPLTAQGMLLVQLLSRDEILDPLGNYGGVHSWGHIGDGFSRLLSLHSETGVEVLEVYFEGFLYGEIGKSHGIFNTFGLNLEIAGFLNSSNDLATLLGEEDADRQELSNIDVSVHHISDYIRIGFNGCCSCSRSIRTKISHF